MGQCAQAEHDLGTPANGKTQYYRTALTPVILAPGQATVFPLPPEFAAPQDGQVKQDCELNAGTRWLQRWGGPLAAWRTTVLGDDLYCHQPFCEQVLAQGCVSSSSSAYRARTRCSTSGWPISSALAPTLVRSRWTGTQRLTDTYRWLNDLPLRDGNNLLPVGLCELITTDAAGNVLYRNAWASSQPIDADTVVALVAAEPAQPPPTRRAAAQGP